MARGAAGEEEIGDVRAGDEEHESDRAEKCEKGWFYFPNETFVQRPKGNVPAFVRLMKLLLEPRVDRAHASLRLLQIDIGIEARDRGPGAVIARFFREVDRARHPNLCLLRVLKPGRHHTNNRERPRAHLDLFPDDRGVGAKTAFPHAMADYRNDSPAAG